MSQAILLVNFGGPRELTEVEPFLISLLTDRELIRTPLPNFLHNWLFRRVARKRAKSVSHDYALIGGFSPIFASTEALADALRKRRKEKILTFHRYLPATHAESIRSIEECEASEVIVLPLFPQFSYATTGSIATFLAERLKRVGRLRWIKSFPAHPAFVAGWQKQIRAFLAEKDLKEEDVVLFFSAHGIPCSFVEGGDPYEFECRQSYEAVMTAFPKALGKLAYQSKFGKGEWLKPYTNEECERASEWCEGRKHVVFVPLSFTSDHIETLFEIQYLYLPPIEKQGLKAWRCPVLDVEPALDALLAEQNLCATQMLLRNRFRVIL